MARDRAKRLALQALNYAMFMAVVWYFSFSPPYRQLAADEAVVTVAFGHTSERIAPCVALTPDELAQLAPNMRKPMDCPRERSPVTLELRLDGEVFAREVIQPPGLYRDQRIDVFREVTAREGAHRLSILMNDDASVEGPTYRLQDTVVLRPAQRLVVAFSKAQGFYIP
ncbi:MAG: hypothetical protein U5S82_04995 [Gammaproteobacteria bacterium]|nr:hypothetical protein [Gammaproteobacteria bacterium]